jgi:hypothetical protein
MAMAARNEVPAVVAAGGDPEGTFTPPDVTTSLPDLSPAVWNPATVGGVSLDSRSATALLVPAICRMSEVYSAMKERCLCWRAVHDSVVRARANVNGLWSDEDDEAAALKYISEMSDATDDSEQVPVEGAISLFGWGQLLGKKS